MDSFLSKIFNSKNKKQVYNVDKNKRQNLKKASKNLNQFSSAYFTNKLRKEFGIYRPKSEFSSTKYNIPCVVQNRESSIESVDIIPQTFLEEQNVDLVKCSQDNRQKNKTMLFVNDSHSDMEPESINKEFGIDKTEGCNQQEVQFGAGNIADDISKNNRDPVTSLNSQTIDNTKLTEGREQEETSNEDSSQATTEVRKDSLYGRYDDTCVQLNSYKCNKEFIFESTKKEDVKSNNVDQIADSPILDNIREFETFVANDTPQCSKFSEHYDPNLECNVKRGTIEEIHELNQLSINKKGRIKCKSPDKEKIKKCKKVKEDEGLSRHRYYHSMIILGGKKKTKSNHSKNIKITNTQILEVTQKKFGDEILKEEPRNPLDFLPCDERRINLVQNPRTTVRTMCYRNANNKLYAVNIPPSEHTLKWLEENFGPGSQITTLNDPDEIDFPDPLEDLNFRVDQNCTENCPNAEDDPNIQGAITIQKLIEKDVDLNSKENNDSCTDSILPNKIESDCKRKTVRVLSFNKSRTLKSNNSSYENSLDNIDEMLGNDIKNERNIASQNQNGDLTFSTRILKEVGVPIKEKPESLKENEEDIEVLSLTCLESEKKGYLKQTRKKWEVPNSILLVEDNYAPIKEKNESLKENEVDTEVLSNSKTLNYHSSENKGYVKQTRQKWEVPNSILLAEDNSVPEKDSLSEPIPRPVKSYGSIQKPLKENYTTSLKLQNENILGILRAQEKISIAQEEKRKTLQKHEEHDKNPPDEIVVKLESRDEKIVLKLNDKIVNVDDKVVCNNNAKQEHKIENKFNRQCNKKCLQDDSKRRHEELEKDYLMTRLELALDKEIIEKPEITKHILGNSQEVLNDIVENNDEKISLKLNSETSANESKKNIKNVRTVDSSVLKKEYDITETKRDIQETKKHNIDEQKGNCEDKRRDIKEKMNKSAEKQDLTAKSNVKHESSRTPTKDLNNISKIENVKIYRKDIKKSPDVGKKATLIRINSIDNIMKNKTLLLEEIKSLKRKK